MLDVVKCENTVFDIRKILVCGNEKTGKTTFISTLPRPILVFAGETGAESRFAGTKDIDVVQCYDKQGELPGAGIRRFDKNFNELLTMKETQYKTIAIDPLSFLSDYILSEIDRTNPGLRGSSSTFKFWEILKDKHSQILSKVLSMAQYVVVTSHVRLRDDETTGSQMFVADLNGSIRDSIGGWFDAVFFTKIVPTPTGAKFMLQSIPDAKHKCGVRLPLGMESKIGKEVEPDYQKLINAVKGVK